MVRWIALTGTPGTGKSTVARHLPRAIPHREVRDVALEVGAARSGPDRSVVVDVRRLQDRLPQPTAPVAVLVGHLAHLLPVRSIIVLRCHPLVLEQRLGRARRGRARDRLENVGSEAIDVILTEARATGLPVVEIDTTGRGPRSVAREVARIVRGDPPRRAAPTEWLTDPAVVARLIAGPRRPRAPRPRLRPPVDPKRQERGTP